MSSDRLTENVSVRTCIVVTLAQDITFVEINVESLLLHEVDSEKVRGIDLRFFGLKPDGSLTLIVAGSADELDRTARDHLGISTDWLRYILVFPLLHYFRWTVWLFHLSVLSAQLAVSDHAFVFD